LSPDVGADSESQRIAFFDATALTWDHRLDLPAERQRLDAGLAHLGVQPDERVVDVGCGTGNLTLCLLAKLSEKGRVAAVDISPRMIGVAREKTQDSRVTWHVEDARRLTLDDGDYDRVICYSVWPHFEDRKAVATELARVLKVGGLLHVWHTVSRCKINKIHAACGAAIANDVLPPVEETSDVLLSAGFRIIAAVESDESYLVTAAKLA